MAQPKIALIPAAVMAIGHLLACTPTGSDHGGAVDERALEASSQTPKADGDFVSLAMVSPQGVFICQKPNGQDFESKEKNPIVQLWIDDQLREEKPYNNTADADSFIVFDTRATSDELGLAPGPHNAQCKALPDWPDFNPDADPNDAWFHCETDTDTADVCTPSGVLMFSLAKTAEPPPDLMVLSQTLNYNCGEGEGHGDSRRKCTGWIDIPAGTAMFGYPCAANSTWAMTLLTKRSKSDNKDLAVITRLQAVSPDGKVVTAPESKNVQDKLSLEVGSGGYCAALVTAYDNVRIKLTLSAHFGKPPSAGHCHELCVTQGTAAAGWQGCDCSSYCASACQDVGVSCGDMPECNIDFGVSDDTFGQYNCPYREDDLDFDHCEWWPLDDGAFEHEGPCYRCGTGQQCCYTGGRDNGTGSFDLCPPFALGVPAPNGCGGTVEHCECDVIPLCACMAVQGDITACEQCIGSGNLDILSCNPLGDDAVFCTNAVTLQEEDPGFDWCAILGSTDTCWQRPMGFLDP